MFAHKTKLYVILYTEIIEVLCKHSENNDGNFTSDKFNFFSRWQKVEFQKAERHKLEWTEDRKWKKVHRQNVERTKGQRKNEIYNNNYKRLNILEKITKITS